MYILDTTAKRQDLQRGKYADTEVVVYNANEIEIAPDYPYRRLQARVYREVTGNVNGIEFDETKDHKAIIWPYFWLMDTCIMCWHPENSGTDSDRYWQTSKPATSYYTCMLGQQRPHRELIFDLLNSHDIVSEYLTFVPKGITRDVIEDDRVEIGGMQGKIRCHWNGENQQKTHRFPPWYDETLIDLVVETHEDAIFFTEKTWKPFLGMRLPLIYGGAHTVQKLMEWGFRFPHDMIDYSYDREPHPYIRAKSMVEELKRVMTEIPLDVLDKHTMETRKFNQRRCFSLMNEVGLQKELPPLQDDLARWNLFQKVRKFVLDF